MSRTSKSPRAVALEALEVGARALPLYSHKFSPKKFTQPQLFACLVLKAFFATDYRGVAEILRDCDGLVAALGLKAVPHFTTLQKACERLMSFGPASDLLTATVERGLGRNARVELAAGDSTGFESGRVSPYFVRRRSRERKDREGRDVWQTTSYTRFPKLELVCDCATHLILCAVPGLGPHPDTARLRPLLFNALTRVGGIGTALFDAGYDCEAAHAFARDGCLVRSVIPPLTGRPTDKPPSTPHRRRMRRYRDFRYGQRWQAETVVSMIKRRQGHHAAGRSDASRDRDLRLKAIAHNVMVVPRAA